jgi:serine/threonine-protein kinase
VLALGQWGLYTNDKERQKWLVEVARLADPGGWRALAGDLTNLNDDATLDKLVETAPGRFPSAAILVAVRHRLVATGRDPVPFLKRLQEAHPDDYSINYYLGHALIERDPAGAVRYCQAAVSVRPNSVAANLNLGHALRALGRLDEAVTRYRRVEELSRPSGRVHLDLAEILTQLGRHEEAEAELRKLALHPKYTHSAPRSLRSLLVRHGRAEQALLEWKETLTAHPADYEYREGYAELCLFLGREDEYRCARQSLLAALGSTDNPIMAGQAARTCLLLPADGDELRQAVALAARAGAAARDERQRYLPIVHHLLFAEAVAEHRQGRFDRAITLLQGEASRVAGPAPRLVLAQALHRAGRATEARATLAGAVAGYDWRPGRAAGPDDWACHVLRREAEGMILPGLVKGDMPRDNEERLALLGVLESADRNADVAATYADAFAAEPALAEDRDAGHRYRAACFAALAGCGRGKDAARLGERERARWRAQALDWLRADLTAWEVPAGGDAASRFRTRSRLTGWRNDPDLAGLRDPAALAKLSAEERKEWFFLWTEVEALFRRTAISR